MGEKKPVVRGELALAIAVVINALGVKLMLYAGAGISAISSVPYAFSEVFPIVTMGTWTYIFQGLLVAALMVLRRRFVPEYLLSFVVGFFFGVMIDIHQLWIPLLPVSVPLRVLYFIISYLLMCVGIAISNRCKTPIIPTDLFPRELSWILNVPYARVKSAFDLSCLLVTAVLTLLCLGHIIGLGLGTVVAALTVGKGVGFTSDLLDRYVDFVSVFEPGRPAKAASCG